LLTATALLVDADELPPSADELPPAEVLAAFFPLQAARRIPNATSHLGGRAACIAEGF